MNFTRFFHRAFLDQIRHGQGWHKTSPSPRRACHDAPRNAPLVFSSPRLETVVCYVLRIVHQPALRWAQNVESWCASRWILTSGDAIRPCGRTRRGQPCLGANRQFVSAVTEASRLHPVAFWGRSSTARTTTHPCTTEASAAARPRALASRPQIRRDATELHAPRRSHPPVGHVDPNLADRPTSISSWHPPKDLRRSACRRSSISPAPIHHPM